MKKLLALGLGCMLAQGAMADDEVAKNLPAFPANCADQIAGNGLFCSNYVVTGDKVAISFVAVVEKDAYAGTNGDAVKNLINLYTNFAKWPDYAKASTNSTIIEFTGTGSVFLGNTLPTAMPAAVVPVTNTVLGKHYFHSYDYTLKVQGIPLLKQAVRGVTDNYVRVTPYQGAVASLEFAAKTGAVAGILDKPKGMKSQTGSVHVAECDGSICGDGQLVVVYETTVQPDISFAMDIAAKTAAAGIEDLLTGMLHQ